MIRMGVSGCFFWYWPTRVLPDQRPLNSCVCVCVCVCKDCMVFLHKQGNCSCQTPPPIQCCPLVGQLLWCQVCATLCWVIFSIHLLVSPIKGRHTHKIVWSGFSATEELLVSVTHTHTHTRLTALCPGLPRWVSTRKVKPIWILLKQETVSGSGISWDICKSAPHSRQITMPALHHSVFYRPGALPAAQPTVSKHCWLGGCFCYIYSNQASKFQLTPLVGYHL